MGILDRLSGGAEKVAKEAEKVFEQGKTKVEELQLERQMDMAARKLGYLEYDSHRGRTPEPAKREELLAELTKLEGQLSEMRAARDAEAQESQDRAQAGGEMSEVSRVEAAAAATGTAPHPVSGGGGSESVPSNTGASQSATGGQLGSDMAEAKRVQEAAAATGVAPQPVTGDTTEDADETERGV